MTILNNTPNNCNSNEDVEGLSSLYLYQIKKFVLFELCLQFVF